MSPSGPAFARLAPDERRRQLLNTANHLFAERGYDGVSVEDIAREADVTRGLIHHYFGGKRDVYLALLEELSNMVDEALGDPPAGTPEDRLNHTIRSWLDCVDANRTMWAATGGRGDDIPDPGVAAIVNARREASVSRLIHNHRDIAGEGPELHFAVESWLGLNQAACRIWLAGGASREQTHDLLIRVLHHIFVTYGVPADLHVSDPTSPPNGATCDPPARA
jgi:AcrR family transcriptional regulator